MLLKESEFRELIREEIKKELEEIKMGVHDPRAEEMISQEKSGQAADVLHALDVILSQFQAIHSGQASREAASKARKNAKIVYEFVKGKENRRAQGIFPPHEIKAMAIGLGKNPEDTVEKYIRPVLSLKKQVKSSS